MPALTAPHATANPDDAALIDASGTTTWSTLDDRVRRLRNALFANGAEVGGTIAVVAENRRELFETFLAGMHSGLRFVPVNWHWAPSELTYVFDDAAVTTVVTSPRFVANVVEAVEALPADERPRVLVFDDDVSAGDTGTATATGVEVVSFEAALESAPDVDAPEAMGVPMFYTSGTTGRPKGVRASNVDFTADPSKFAVSAGRMTEALGIPIPGVTLLSGPAYHSAQWAFSLYPLVTGSTLVIQDKFDPEGVLALIDEHRVTNCHLVPTQFVRMLRLPEATRERYDVSSVQLCLHGAAPCSEDVKRAMIDWWGPVIEEYYGSTEGAVISVISTAEWLERPTSVGRANPGIEVQVIDEDGNAAAPGVEGELYFRRPGRRFEYHNDSDKTSRTVRDDGWFTTGDCGFVDDGGYIHLHGRKIDMIISGGVNIYPAEIESVLATHPAVDDVAVFGVPDDEFGESVKAAVKLAAGFSPDDELVADLERHCRDNLAGYKAPRSFDFHDDLPRLESGKIQKHVLRERYWADAGRTT